MLRGFRQVWPSFRSMCLKSSKFGMSSLRSRRIGVSLCTATSVAVAVPKLNLEPGDAETLTSSTMIKNASVQTVDAATTLLTRTVVALVEVEKLYAESLGQLLKLMEMNLQVLGDQFREDRVWDAMLEVRGQINVYRQQKQELETIFYCAEQALQAAAEASHASGAEYGGITASERTFSARTYLEHFQKQSQEAELLIQKLEAKTIEQTAKHAEKEKARLKTEKLGEAEQQTQVTDQHSHPGINQQP